MELPEIPGYRVKKPLGKGAMAVVYLASKDDIDRPVALKLMARHLQADPGFGERFLREARICAQLSHPNIVAIYDVGQHESYRYMAMECLTGGDLKVRMKKGLPIRDGIDIVKGIAAGLDYAHSKNFIHRDIKPENILFRADGTPVISDFGIARNTDSHTQMTKTGTVIGSPHYMSPEQAEAAQLDGRSDLYSLGIILYEMLTGRVPFKGESAISIGIKHITTPAPPLPPQVAGFQRFIDKALAKNREDRFQSGAELLAALEAVDADFSDEEAATVVLSEDVTRAIRDAAPARTNEKAKAKHAAAGPANGASARAKTPKRGALMAAAGFLTLGLVAGAAWLYQEGRLISESDAGGGLHREEIDLLHKADMAMSEARYYSPAGDNAQHYLTTLLALNPHSAEAQAALHRLFETYLREAEQALARSNHARANDFLNQGSQITFYIQESSLLERLRQLRARASAHR